MKEQFNYIPKKEFQQMMKISRWTFTEWVNNHKLPIIRIGYRTFIPFTEYKEWEKKYHKNIPQSTEQKKFEWKNIF